MKNQIRKTTRLLITLGFILFGLVLIIFSLSRMQANFMDFSAKARSSIESKMENYVDTDVPETEDLDFADNLVTISLTKEATLLFKNYTPDDFIEVNAVGVNDLTSYTVDWVRKKTLNIPTQEKMLINIEKFRRTLSIELAENSRENVLFAAEILRKRDDVESASPSYYQKKQLPINCDYLLLDVKLESPRMLIVNHLMSTNLIGL